MRDPLIEVRGLRREFPAGDGVLTVLKDIHLTIQAGEMVAIIGASGSGKSTLMNILGCLDRPTAGEYRVSGRATADLDPDELAELRREYFGFIFQRYQLLGDLPAVANVEVPAIYAGVGRGARRERAADLLARLGLADRLDHRPGQLSGGQQQRVSIARALMNDGDIVLADEPTGALDTRSGEEVMRILKALNAEGRTIIIVTHDAAVAAHCERIIEIRDGEIVSDRRSAEPRARATPTPSVLAMDEGVLNAAADRFREAFRMALLAMNAHRLRTFLTMLGIIIGIASVVSVVALGEGSRRQVLENISSIGTNTLDIMPGKSFGDMRSGAIRTLVVADAEALAQQPYVDSVTPAVQSSGTLRAGNVAATGTIYGVGEQYFRVRGLKLAQGRLFDATDVGAYAQSAVIDDNTLRTLFPNRTTTPLGEVILAGGVPARIVGVLEKSSGGFGPGGGSDSLSVYLPYTSLQARLLGETNLRSITVRVRDDTDSQVAQSAVTDLLSRRHGSQDFFIINTDQIRQTITSTTETMTVLIAAIAVISLIVGGIGVMNIMLVSVTERTGEIGVRIAVGARQSDVLQQFLVEAVLVCLLGGTIGVLLALAFGAIFALFPSSFTLAFSPLSILAAFACSTLIGVVFGYLPARNAARLDPVVALARD
ncbi:MAG: macrolide ABC transporter permease/ATP-binding protein MacB [Phenylobacterium zucineum]|nr:MAG: macrolide ABC transporter permease/ATP-binding protein MacB [Phenylobacterium zucineum]